MLNLSPCPSPTGRGDLTCDLEDGLDFEAANDKP